MGQFTMPENAKKLGWKVTMQRNDAFPLDMSSVFFSEDDALSYVKEEKKDVGVPYIGQIITVTAENDDPKTYCINKLGGTYAQLTDYCSEIGADVALDSEIKVEGGPLADLLTGNEITTIPAGTTFEQFVSMLTRKEKWPSLSYQKATIDASITVPTITFDKTGTTLEVGTSISMNAITFSGTTIVSSNPCKVVGFTHGYSLEKSGDIINATAITAGNKTTNIDDNGYARKFNITSGFNGGETQYSLPSDVTSVTVSEMNTSEHNIGYLSEGNNTITLSVTGGTASVLCDEINSYYMVSNFGNRDDEHKSNKNTNTTASDTPTGNTSKTITGKYKFYMGYTTAFNYAKDATEEKVKAIDPYISGGNNWGWLNKDATTVILNESNKIKSNGGAIVIAIPDKYNLKTAYHATGASILDNFESSTISGFKIGGDQTETYKVYVHPVLGGGIVEYCNVQIGL